MFRAKMVVQSVEKFTNVDSIKATPVSGKGPYGPQGESEDNTFARYTPSGSLQLSITNPDLVGKIQPGDTFYVDFTKVES